MTGFNSKRKMAMEKTTDYSATDLVYVLTENTEDGNSVIGVYETHELAEQEKFAVIRDYFDITEDEVADADLEAEVDHAVTYEIVQRRIQRR
jgi:hypothetical protein